MRVGRFVIAVVEHMNLSWMSYWLATFWSASACSCFLEPPEAEKAQSIIKPLSRYCFDAGGVQPQRFLLVVLLLTCRVFVCTLCSLL